MYVCLCNGITDGQIQEAVAQGARTLADLRAELGVATSCARCANCAEQVMTEFLCELPYIATRAKQERSSLAAPSV